MIRKTDQSYWLERTRRARGCAGMRRRRRKSGSVSNSRGILPHKPVLSLLAGVHALLAAVHHGPATQATHIPADRWPRNVSAVLATLASAAVWPCGKKAQRSACRGAAGGAGSAKQAEPITREHSFAVAGCRAIQPRHARRRSARTGAPPRAEDTNHVHTARPSPIFLPRL